MHSDPSLSLSLYFSWLCILQKQCILINPLVISQSCFHNPVTGSSDTSKALGPVLVGYDLQAAVVSSVPADAEQCSQGRHYMHWDETCSDSRLAPRVHYQRLVVKSLVCLHLKRSSIISWFGWNISSCKSYRVHWVNFVLTRSSCENRYIHLFLSVPKEANAL